MQGHICECESCKLTFINGNQAGSLDCEPCELTFMNENHASSHLKTGTPLTTFVTRKIYRPKERKSRYYNAHQSIDF
ncbi:hypothetical protein CEXT_257901 [Caerostris extrusa]|uniref:C2H2-type domain-containing protein n=1 Tax=Caerostris extrusa TaxID=172846 RepID=A0AAV4TT29_CAEEX|nr:hypothetical protein CEXT_257901 [Caerostris extrusa]